MDKQFQLEQVEFSFKIETLISLGELVGVRSSCWSLGCQHHLVLGWGRESTALVQKSLFPSLLNVVFLVSIPGWHQCGFQRPFLAPSQKVKWTSQDSLDC